MSTVEQAFPLQTALDQVSHWLQSANIDGAVNKVEISRNGRLYFELIVGDQRRWLCWENDELKELNAAQDTRIPLAAMLQDSGFAATAKLLSYRPRRRLTLRDGSHYKACILKGFRHGHIEEMITRYETAHLAFSGHGVNAPEIFEYDRDNDSLVMALQPGERLRLSADSADLFQTVGEALRGFQDYPDHGHEQQYGSRDELDVIDKRAARLEQASGTLPGAWPELRQRIETVHKQLPIPQFGLAHRDLHDKQFVQQSNFLTLLDFDLMCTADNTLDAANFLAHMVLRNLQGVQGATQRSIDSCGKHFLQGLGRNEDPGFWQRLRFYQATSFCRLALVYVLRPRWDHLVRDMVTMGNRCLDDLQRIER